MRKTVVLAVGGNALARRALKGTFEEQRGNASRMARAVAGLLDAGWRVVVTHGNGPQIGNLAIQQEATSMVPAQPLGVLGAMTQGQIGHVLGLALMNATQRSAPIASLVTLVDGADPAFTRPTKPIGPFFTRRPRIWRRSGGGRSCRTPDGGSAGWSRLPSPDRSWKPRRSRGSSTGDSW